MSPETLNCLYCFSTNTRIALKKGTSIKKLTKIYHFEMKNIPKKTLTRSDENSCTKNLAITDLANTDFETLTRSAKKKNSTS